MYLKYIMLNPSRHDRQQKLLISFLLFISISSFQAISYANPKQEIAEEYRSKGFTQYQQGNLNEALTYYSKALSLGAETPEVLNDVAIIYEKIDLKRRAESLYLQAIRTDPSYLPAYLNLAYLYKSIGALDKAAYYFRMRYELAQENDSWANTAKEELIKINPEYSQWILHNESLRLEQEVIEQSQREFYENVLKSQEHYARGNSHFDNNDYEQALNEFNMALQLTPGQPKLLEARKKVILELTKNEVKKHTDEAIKMLNSGDAVSAQQEIKKILTKLPEQPAMISR